MKIPTTILICIATSVAQSTGSNSSILESKIRGGLKIDGQFALLYLGFLVKSETGVRVASLTFINGRNCMTTRVWGEQAKKYQQFHEVLAPASLGGQKYNISSVLVPDRDDHVAAFFSIIKLKRFLKDPTYYISFVNTRVPSFEMRGVLYYMGGWDEELLIPELRYLEMTLDSFKRCKGKIRQRFKKNLHNLACASTKDGAFDKLDIGTPLFMGNNEMLGVAVAFRETAAIFALVYNDVQLIKAFINHDGDLREGTGDDTGEDTGKATGEPSNAYLDPRCGADTPHLYDTSHMHPGQMGSSHQYDMGYMDPGLMGTRYPLEMSHMDPGQMGTPYQYNMGHINPDQMGTPNLPDMTHSNSDQMGFPHPPDTSHIHPGQMGYPHLSDTSHMNLGPIGHTSSQYEPDTDDLMSIVRPRKPSNTRSQQSSDANQEYNGPHSARVSGTMFQNPNVQASIRVPQSFGLTSVRPVQNPRTRGNRPEK